MGFLDTVIADKENGGGEGGDYVNEAEVDDIIAKRIPFTISDITVRDNPFGGADSVGKLDQYVLTIQLAGEDRLKTFNKGVASRDRSLDALMASDELKAGPVGPVTLRKEPTKRGRSVVLFDAV
jgi:hypothetical protein